jgi:hypothetical protein
MPYSALCQHPNAAERFSVTDDFSLVASSIQAFQPMARQRQTSATTLHLVTETTDEAVARVADARRPDPRLVDLVRQLARQAARDFVQQETARLPSDRLPD